MLITSEADPRNLAGQSGRKLPWGVTVEGTGEKLYVALQARPADWGAVVEEVKRGGL